MSTEYYEKFDIKTLVLKRWDASKTKHLFDDNHQRGQYVSFQSHHFIDILPSDDTDGLLGAYNNIRKLYYVENKEESEKYRNSQHVPDVHIVQSIPLLGKKGAFWDTDANILYITLIQLSDSSRWEYDQIFQAINDFFATANQYKPESEQISTKHWSLYYSLDYCDYVLFTKDIKLNLLNDLLWEMALIRHGQFYVIRDTFTIISFGWNYLKNAFVQIENGEDPVWDDVMSLSMNFCLRDISAVETLTNAIASIDNGAIKCTNHRLSGRYDWNIFAGPTGGSQVIKIIYQINSILKQPDAWTAHNTQSNLNQVQTQAHPSISEYQINLLSDPPKFGAGVSPRHSKFDKYATTIINKLYGMFTQEYAGKPLHFSASYADYAKETLRSLYELANSDFSEEFVLTVLPSLITFLRIVDQKQQFLRDEKDISAQEAIHASCAKLQKSYFTALNTLSLCTMHSERQFIHSPAFNANYFTIPPKLLAYYSAVVYQIANHLRDCTLEKPLYNYVIAPDYRTDIHVEPLNISYKTDTKDHLAIINLPEKYFYQPQKAVMLFAHEVGHYEGDRKRELRADCIFFLVGVCILRYSPLIGCISNQAEAVTNQNLWGLMAASFGKYMKAQYDLQYKTEERDIHYLLASITEYLRICDYGLKYFREYRHKQNLISQWIDALKSITLDANMTDEIKGLLLSLSERDNTSYYYGLSNTPQCIGVCDAIARNIANHCEAIATEDADSYQRIVQICQDVVSLFSEAYADMQMVSILGTDYFNLEDYCETLEEIEGHGISLVNVDSEEDLPTSHMLRYIILRRRLNGSIECNNQLLPLLQETEVRCVLYYLAECQNSACLKSDTEFLSSMLSSIYRKEPNQKEWCESLCTVLADYENHIQSMFRLEDDII